MGRESSRVERCKKAGCRPGTCRAKQPCEADSPQATPGAWAAPRHPPALLLHTEAAVPQRSTPPHPHGRHGGRVQLWCEVPGALHNARESREELAQPGQHVGRLAVQGRNPKPGGRQAGRGSRELPSVQHGGCPGGRRAGAGCGHQGLVNVCARCAHGGCGIAGCPTGGRHRPAALAHNARISIPNDAAQPHFSVASSCSSPAASKPTTSSALPLWCCSSLHHGGSTAGSQTWMKDIGALSRGCDAGQATRHDSRMDSMLPSGNMRWQAAMQLSPKPPRLT